MVRVAAVAGAVALGLAAVVLSVVLGPPTFAEGGLLDQLRLAGGPAPDQGVGGPVTDGTVRTTPVGEPVLGVPLEVVGVVLATTVAAALLVRSLLRAAREPAAVEEPEPDPLGPVGTPVDVAGVREAVREAVLDLDDLAGRDPAEVVIACWVRLEVAGSAAGSLRRLTDTPTEFALRLQHAAPGLDTGALLRLRSVYSRVRFGSGGATAADVVAAREALADLMTTLAPAASVGRDGPGG